MLRSLKTGSNYEKHETHLRGFKLGLQTVDGGRLRAFRCSGFNRLIR